MKIVVTGSAGFIGGHLVEALRARPGVEVAGIVRQTDPLRLEEALSKADVVFHLAGTNRPTDPAEFQSGNAGFTSLICRTLEKLGGTPLLVFASSIQAALDNPYGKSKLAAEAEIGRWVSASGSSAAIFRLRNVFGKWCRPNYNSVTATFCHNIARDLPIAISDPGRELELVYIDDVIAGLVQTLDSPPPGGVLERREIPRFVQVSLGRLAAMIQSFRASRTTLVVPSFEEDFSRRLYATYLSYLPGSDFSYALDQKSDPRGTLAEFIKAPHFGQIFVSRTKPGVTRGNHYHHTKTEKFLVVEGEAVIRFRKITGQEVIEHRVSGTQFRVVDIPPGYTHNIENIGPGELVTLFWACEIFDPARPDTIFVPVNP